MGMCVPGDRQVFPLPIGWRLPPRWQASAGGVSAGASTVPHVRGAGTVPVYSCPNAIRESVRVQTTMDSDGDRVPDKVAVDVVRPRKAAAAQVKVPVIMEASPYYGCCGRGNESEKKTYDAKGVISKVPLFYDNYFVPRGYAFVAVDLPGTGRSTGCQDFGGRAEVLRPGARTGGAGGLTPSWPRIAWWSARRRHRSMVRPLTRPVSFRRALVRASAIVSLVR